MYGSGIQRGDIITKIDDKPVDDYTQLQKIIESYQVGNTVKVTYMRGDSEQTAEVTLQELAPQTDSDN